MTQVLNLTVNGKTIEGELTIPQNASGLVIFSHGSGSSRFSPRNNFVAQRLQERHLGTFLVDLLTYEEDEISNNRFNIDLLAMRLIEITKQLTKLPSIKNLSIGYFGASTGAASAIIAACHLKKQIHAVVSRGGRPDLAKEYLSYVSAPTLFIVGELDQVVALLNKESYKKINAPKELKVVKNATHLFEESGALEKVADLAGDWFVKYLQKEREPATQIT